MGNSKNKYDVYAWVMKVVKSAVTDDQKRSAAKLIRNFQWQFDLYYTDRVMDTELDMVDTFLGL